MSADIQVKYYLRSTTSGTDGAPSLVQLIDWYSVADWIKESNERGYTVCVLSWTYIHSMKRE